MGSGSSTPPLPQPSPTASPLVEHQSRTSRAPTKFEGLRMGTISKKLNRAKPSKVDSEDEYQSDEDLQTVVSDGENDSMSEYGDDISDEEEEGEEEEEGDDNNDEENVQRKDEEMEELEEEYMDLQNGEYAKRIQAQPRLKEISKRIESSTVISVCRVRW